MRGSIDPRRRDGRSRRSGALMENNMKQDDDVDDDEHEHEMIFWYHVCRTTGMAHKTSHAEMIRQGYAPELRWRRKKKGA